MHSLTMLVFPLLLASSTLAAPIYQNSSDCASLHVIVARGTTESQTQNKGEGWMYVVANMITSQVPDSDSIGLVYPASGAGNVMTPSYYDSVPMGIAALRADLKNYTKTCPHSKIALIGYSQGGQVVGDTLCGTSELHFPPSGRLPHKWAKNIVAAITFGDPAHVLGEVYDAGNATVGIGIFPRITTAACEIFAPIMQAYCNADDKYCDSGNSLAMHGSYVAANGRQSASFVLEKYNAAIS